MMMKYGLIRVVGELIINENDEKIMETVTYYIFIYPTLLWQANGVNT
jgi:hypothetical protein